MSDPSRSGRCSWPWGLYGSRIEVDEDAQQEEQAMSSEIDVGMPVIPRTTLILRPAVPVENH